MSAQVVPALESHKFGSWLRDVILGGQDGLVNVLGIILGLWAANSSTSVILTASLAATFAEAVSMGAVAYTSAQAEKDHYESEKAREFREVEQIPEIEKKEIRDIYEKKGFKGDLLNQIVEKISTNKEVWVNIMMEEELRLEPVEGKNIIFGSVVVFLAALIGSFVPVIPFMIFTRDFALAVSLITSSLVLFGVGVFKARTMVGVWWKSGLQMLLIGMGAAAAGFIIGLIFHTT